METAAELDASVAAAGAPLDLARHLAEVEDVGFTIVPGVFPLDLCERMAEHTDAMLAPQELQHLTGAGLTENRGPVARSHPIPGSVMGEVFSTPRLLAVASALGRAPASELRLFEQVMLRTHVVPPEMMDEPGPTPRGYHIDDVFAPEMFHATPRQTYFQLFMFMRDVEPGAGATMVSLARSPPTLAPGPIYTQRRPPDSPRPGGSAVAPRDDGRGARAQPRRRRRLLRRGQMAHA